MRVYSIECQVRRTVPDTVREEETMASANMLAATFIHRFGGGRGNTEFGLLLIGLAFAGVLVWAIQRSGKPTT